jgi:hypothetical protein
MIFECQNNFEEKKWKLVALNPLDMLSREILNFGERAYYISMS